MSIVRMPGSVIRMCMGWSWTVRARRAADRDGRIRPRRRCRQDGRSLAGRGRGGTRRRWTQCGGKLCMASALGRVESLAAKTEDLHCLFNITADTMAGH